MPTLWVGGKVTILLIEMNRTFFRRNPRKKCGMANGQKSRHMTTLWVGGKVTILLIEMNRTFFEQCSLCHSSACHLAAAVLTHCPRWRPSFPSPARCIPQIPATQDVAGKKKSRW
jgi:hypothetical protein